MLAYCIVHEEAIVEVKGVIGGVVHEGEQGLEPSRVDGRRAEPHAAEHSADGVRHELRAGRYPVMVLAGHLHHPAPLLLKELRATMQRSSLGQRFCLSIERDMNALFFLLCNKEKSLAWCQKRNRLGNFMYSVPPL